MELIPTQRCLLVEGRSDQHTVQKLLGLYDLESACQIVAKGSYEEIRESIYNEVNASQRRVLGILADANDHPERRWQSIADQLRRANCAVPPNPCPSGTIFAGTRRIRIGVWLMPDNQRPGELEDFVAEMIPEDDPIWPRSQHYINDIPDDQRKFRPGKITRAQVHAWLATRRTPRPMGTALTAGDLNHTAQLPTLFVNWIRELFNT